MPTILTTIHKTAPAVTPLPAMGADAMRRYDIVLTSPRVDRDKDRVLPTAIDLGRTPSIPLLLGHDRDTLPVGRVTNLRRAADGAVHGTAELPPVGRSARADEAAALIDFSHVSIGFLPETSLPNSYGGTDYTKIDLFEASLVAVPSNVDAVVVGAAKHVAVERAALQMVMRSATNPSGDGSVTDPEARSTGDLQRDAAGCAAGALCPKVRTQRCPVGEGCPMHKSVPPEFRQERVRRLEAMVKGWTEVLAWRTRDAKRARWDMMKAKLLAVDVIGRPVLVPYIDVPRAEMEQMPPDVKALVFGHVDPAFDLESA